MEKQTKSIRVVATEKFGRDYKIFNNKSTTFAICLNEKNRLKAAEVNRISYFIFDIKNSEIIFEDSLSNSNVGWENDNLVTVTRIPGMIKKNDESINRNKIYSFDVLSRKKLFN